MARLTEEDTQQRIADILLGFGVGSLISMVLMFFVFYSLLKQKKGKSDHVRNPHGKPMRLLRSPYGECGGCGVDEKTWCKDDCSRLDPMDYR